MANGAGRRIALLIDADNAPAAKVELVLSEVARHGTATVRRAYGDWKAPGLAPWEAQLHPQAIQPVQQFAYTTRKNASDMAMVIDAMDLLHAGNVDAFALMSSDADFTPLVMRLRAQGAPVYGFGESKAPAAFVNACSQFTHVEVLDEDPVRAVSPAARATRNELRSDTRLVSMLRVAVESSADDEGWAHLATVGQHIRNHASFDSRNRGYGKLLDLIVAIDLFQVDRPADGGGVRIRDKRKRAPAS